MSRANDCAHSTGEATRFRPADAVSWCVQAAGVTVVGPDPGAVRSLAYPEAAVWECVTRSGTVAEAVEIVSPVARVQPGAAADLVGACLHEWLEAGLVEEDAEGG